MRGLFVLFGVAQLLLSVFAAVEIGDLCIVDTATGDILELECVDGASCEFADSFCRGIPRQLGEGCLDAPCADGLYCTEDGQDICAPGDPPDYITTPNDTDRDSNDGRTACPDGSSDCATGETCEFIDNFCYPDPRLLGDLCEYADCADGLYCDRFGPDTICRVPVGLGGDCSGTAQCEAGLKCEFFPDADYLAGELEDKCTPEVDPGTGMQGDPHMVGFDGRSFDYNGMAGQAFSLISTPDYDVNALIAPELFHGMTYAGAIGVVTAGGHTATIRADAGHECLTVEVDDQLVALDGNGCIAGDLQLRAVDTGDVEVTLAGLAFVVEVHRQVFLNLKRMAFIDGGVPAQVDGVLGATARTDRLTPHGLEHEEAYYFVSSILGSLDSKSAGAPRRMGVAHFSASAGGVGHHITSAASFSH